MTWIPIRSKKPKPNQVVLVRCYRNIPQSIKMAYVVRYKNKLEFGAAPDSEFRRDYALKSFPLTKVITHWMPLP